MWLVGRDLNYAVTKANILCPLACRTQKNFRCGGMRILLKKMVFHFPGIVVTQLVRQFDLPQRILHKLKFAVLFPRLGQLMFVENTKFHGQSPS